MGIVEARCRTGAVTEGPVVRGAARGQFRGRDEGGEEEEQGKLQSRGEDEADGVERRKDVGTWWIVLPTAGEGNASGQKMVTDKEKDKRCGRL